MIEVVALVSIKNPRSRQTTPTVRFPTARNADDFSLELGAANLDDKGAVSEKTIYRSKEYRRNKAKPNVYTGLHFQQSINEYATLANANVLAGKDKHRKYKSAIIYTNYANPKRNLLTRDSLAVSVRLLLQGRYPDLLLLTQQIKAIFVENPRLFDGILPRAKQESEV